MPGYTACTACPAHAAQASHQFPTFQPVLHQLPNLRVAPHHTSNTCSQQPGTPGYTACAAAQPVLHQLPNLHLAPHQDLGSRTPAASSQACRAIPDLGSRTPAASSQACQAIQPAQPVQPTQPRPVTVPDMSSSAPTPKFAPQTSPDLRSRTPAASSQACQAIQPAQPVQPTQPRPVTVPDMSSSAPPPKFAPQTSPDLGSRTPAASSQACQAIQPAQPVQPTQPRPVTVPHISTSSPPTPKFAPRTPPHLGSRTPAASSQACQAIQPAQPVQPTQPSQCSTNSQICTSNLTRPRKPNTCS